MFAPLTVLLLTGLATDEPPAIPREFRGVWVATVGNIDWPSKPGLSSDQQQAEARAMLDRFASTGLNAVVFQVRPAADALYASELEPWSYYLTGKAGKAPEPPYDPLAFWVDEAHRRGLQLHAWFNPFRTRQAGTRYEDAPSHLNRAHPELVRDYGNLKWCDPGDPWSRQHTLNVVLDVVRRYDVDGVHLDDYFYPYPIQDETTKKEVPFPDDASFQAARKRGNKLDRDDWRRANINALIESIHREVHKVKPDVLFGISPFGIPRPGHPSGVVGFDQYAKLYADSERWLREGWCDYWSPQLYWKIDSPGQPFRPLLNYWIQENQQNRHVWPGLSISRVGDQAKGYAPEEITGQIDIIREVSGANGSILFSAKALAANRRGLTDRLREETFRGPAAVPGSPWLKSNPKRPTVQARLLQDPRRVEWGQAPTVFQWAIQQKRPDGWSTTILPTSARSCPVEPDSTRVVVKALGRLGEEWPLLDHQSE